MTTEQEHAALETRLRELLHGSDVETARETLAATHPADQADLFQELDGDERRTMLALLSAEGVADLLENLDEGLRDPVVAEMPRATLAKVLDLMETDEAVDILRDMSAAEAVLTISQMRGAAEIVPMLQHEDETAGGIMTRGYVALHRDMTVEEAIAFLRATRPAAEEAYYLFVLDGQNHLQGVVSLRGLIVSDPASNVGDIMAKEVVSVPPDEDQEVAARLLQRYRLRSLPVVDEDGVLQGIITSDDVIEVIQEEATEDMYRIAGLPAEESVYAPLTQSARRRIPWLLINLVAAMAAALVVAAFEGTIEQAAALAVFMPIVAGQGGNAGIQTITIVVRGMALGEIELQDARRVLAKEITIGLVKGLCIGTVVGAIALLWQGDWTWGLVVFAALALNMVVAGAVGSLIPLGLRGMRLDPAVASGIFLTMITDVAGFFFLLGLATVLIV
jgi:magnesium transporter